MAMPNVFGLSSPCPIHDLDSEAYGAKENFFQTYHVAETSPRVDVSSQLAHTIYQRPHSTEALNLLLATQEAQVMFVQRQILRKRRPSEPGRGREPVMFSAEPGQGGWCEPRQTHVIHLCYLFQTALQAGKGDPHPVSLELPIQHLPRSWNADDGAFRQSKHW